MMGCILFFGLFLIYVGISQGREGAYGVVSGLMLLWFVWSLRPGQSRSIDSSVRNKIVAHDGNGRYLVEADTSRQIIGPRPHVVGNLPASLTEVKKGLWVVDSQGYCPDGYSNVVWKPVSEDLSINPRGSESRNFLNDEMNGYEHNYIKGGDE
jgi:hypothetical protein